MRTLLASFVLALPLAAQAPGYVEVDYAKVERKLGKEPRYVGAPLYAMFVLDLAGKHRVWVVADKTTANARYHDVLHADLDGDGDLTEAGERFTGTLDAGKAAAGAAMMIQLGDVRVPGTDLVHTKFVVSTSPKEGRTGFWFRIAWAGKHEMSGGYGLTGLDTTTWGTSPANAPIFRPCPFGPLSFATWGDERIELKAGTHVHLNVLVGNAGSGPNTLAAVDDTFLDLVRDELRVTVAGKNSKGEEAARVTRIKSHC